MKSWPRDKRLALIFPENRISKITQFAIRFMPPMALFILLFEIGLGGDIGPAIATALFAIMLPLQGLYWLGKRAVTPLPLSLQAWHDEIKAKLQQADIAVPTEYGAPTYQSLANVLRKAFDKLDDEFLDKI